MTGKAAKKTTVIIPVDKNMRDYSNEPFIVAKTKRAEEFLKKNGLPKDFQEKSSKEKESK